MTVKFLMNPHRVKIKIKIKKIRVKKFSTKKKKKKLAEEGAHILKRIKPENGTPPEDQLIPHQQKRRERE